MRWPKAGTAFLLLFLGAPTVVAGPEDTAARVTLRSGHVLRGSIKATEKLEAGAFYVIDTEFGEIRVLKSEVRKRADESAADPDASFDAREILVTRLVGNVQKRPHDAEAWTALAWADRYEGPRSNPPNGLIEPGDTVRTGDKALLEVLVHKDAWVRIAANSEVHFSRRPEPRGGSLRLLGGSVLNRVNGMPRDRVFRVASPSRVLGVRGTLFEVSATHGEEWLRVFEGLVSVSGRDAPVAAGESLRLDVPDPQPQPHSASNPLVGLPVVPPPMDMVYVPGGNFEFPLHFASSDVTRHLSKGTTHRDSLHSPPGVVDEIMDYLRNSKVEARVQPCLMDRMVLTRSDFAAYERSLGRSPTHGDDDHVLECSRAEALEVLRWMGKDLPTEAQFEWSYRGLDGRVAPWPNESFALEPGPYNGVYPLHPRDVLPIDVSVFGVRGLGAFGSNWVRDLFVESPFCQRGNATKQRVREWSEAHEGHYVLRGARMGSLQYVYQGARIPVSPDGPEARGLVRGVIDLPPP